MGILWTGGTIGGEPVMKTQAAARDPELARTVRELEFRIARLSLLNQALWELARERMNLTDSDLEKKIVEVDLRDGVEDGAMTNGPLKCPRCGRISNSKHWKCLYCGLEFEKPIMG